MIAHFLFTATISIPCYRGTFVRITPPFVFFRVEESSLQCRRTRFHSLVRKISSEMGWQPTQHSCLGEFCDRAPWWVTIDGVRRSQTQRGATDTITVNEPILVLYYSLNATLLKSQVPPYFKKKDSSGFSSCPLLWNSTQNSTLYLATVSC